MEFIELMPGLPEELALECLTRLHYSAHRHSSRVCRRWRHLLLSNDFYYHRKLNGFTHRAACLVQALPDPLSSHSKSPAQPRYGISLFHPDTLTWDRIQSPPNYSAGLPLFCQVASTEGKLILMGGWDPTSWDPVRDVFVYDFTTQRWTQCADMPSTRSFFAMGAVQGKVFVAGGHDESKNALNSAWVLDIKRNEWKELGRMSEERDECEGVVVGSEFWVVSGYGTEAQGGFKSSAEVYDSIRGEWRRVEDVWRVSRCPRSCVGIDYNKTSNNSRGRGANYSVTCWAEWEAGVQVGACRVDLGERCLVTGSAYQGGAQGLFLVDKKKEGKLMSISVPEEFSGFVQSGCSVEI